MAERERSSASFRGLIRFSPGSLAPGDATAPSLSSTPPINLVGRGRERALLRERLAAAVAGRGGLVLIGGEAGIGKTTLAEELAREAAAQGALALIGRCYDLTETPPYGPWLDLFAHYPEAADLPAPPLVIASGGEVAALPNQTALFGRVRAFFAEVAARRSLVLFLDDLHWADPASLDLLRFLAREVAALPILILVAYRGDELTRHHPLYGLLPLLVREARAERLDLRRLERDDVRALALARYALPESAEADLVAYLDGHAEGNPFYTGELLRALEEEGILHRQEEGWALGDLTQARVPPLLRQVIDGRLARLPEEAQRLLAVAAVIGQEVPLGLWATVAGIEEDALLDVIEGATAARLLEATGTGETVGFPHALVREALYEGLLPPRRRGWHRRVAETLAAGPRPDPDAVASHFQRAGDPRAAAWLVRAGERAQRAYALLTAAERFEAALTLKEAQGADAQERAVLLYRLARMRRYNHPREAIAYLDDAEALAAEAGDRLLTAYAACFRGWLRCMIGEIRRGLTELTAGMAVFDGLPPEEGARLAALQEALGDPPDEHHYRGALTSWLALAGRYAEAPAHGERVVAAGPPPAERGAGASFYANAWRGLASAHAALGRPAAAREAYDCAREAYRAAEHWYQVGNTLTLELYEVTLPYRTDDLAGRRRLADEAEEAWTRASGALVGFPPRLAHLPLLLLEGGWEEARALALAVRAPGGRMAWRPFATSLLALLARDLGETDLAWSLIREQVPEGPEGEPGDTIFLDTVVLQRLAAALALDAGDPATARTWLEAHDRWLAWSGATLGQAEGELLWARYHQAAGDLAAAAERAAAALRHADEPRQPLALLAVHRLLGELDVAAGRISDATVHLGAALVLADDCAAPYERALTLLVLADGRRVGGDETGAWQALDEVGTILAPLGAAPALAAADTLAANLASTPDGGQSFPAGLSAREVEVLRLVAEGLTDVEVAERLFLSPRTVSGHLRSIYNKLGVSSRSAATRFAFEHGLS